MIATKFLLKTKYKYSNYLYINNKREPLPGWMVAGTNLKKDRDTSLKS